jgi:two-component system, NarL family, invasion response regulator UvrY
VISVLICDDHTIVRDGIRQILAETSDIVMAGEASSGPEVLERLRGCRYDVLILDISLPGISGLEVLRTVTALYPKLPVLILTMHPEGHYAVRAVRAGASGYLTKMTASSELITAIRRVASGRRFVTEQLAEQLAAEFQDAPTRSATGALSDRELQVLCLLARGRAVKEIAAELHVSAKTVATYRQRVFAKLGFKNNAELVQFAVHQGLVD